MELESEDGACIFIPKGCKKELGRGPGIAIHDVTVSRRQVLLEVKGPSLNSGSHDNLTDRLHVQVLGPNPVCIVHSRQQNAKTTGRHPQEMLFLRKGDVSYLSAGDKLSLSVRVPVFFTVKEEDQRMREATSGFIERSGSTVGESGKQVTKVEKEKQATQDDLLTSWKARKEGKGISQPDRDYIQSAKGEGTSHLQEEKEVTAKEEEIGIAEAVARRIKRAQERSQQHQQTLQVELDKNSRGGTESLSSIDDDILEGNELAHSLVDTKGIDPVKEFGFLVEGSEFEQFGKRRRHHGLKWDCSLLKGHSGHDEEQEGKTSSQGHYPTSSHRKKAKKNEDDDEWIGENEEEKLVSASVTKSKGRSKPHLRSDRPKSSSSNTSSARARRKLSSNSETKESEEDEDDETLGGFIVDDEEEEEGCLDEEEELSDDEEEDDGDDNNSPAEKVQRQQQNTQKLAEKPLCKYGKKCYRKNKQHHEEFRH